MEPAEVLQYRALITGFQAQLEDRYQLLLQDYQENTRTLRQLLRLQRRLHHRLNLPRTVPHYLDSFRTILLLRQQEIEQETLQIRRIYHQIPPLDPISDPAPTYPVPISRSTQEITGPLYLPPQPQGYTSSDSSSSSSSTSQER